MTACRSVSVDPVWGLSETLLQTTPSKSCLVRRQNAMGTNWVEEAKNGTMTLLSQIAAAVPKLEQDLVRLSQEAEHREKGKAECADKPTRPGTAPRPPAPPLMTGRKKRSGGAKSLFNACNFADSPNTQIPVDSPLLPDAQTRMSKVLQVWCHQMSLGTRIVLSEVCALCRLWACL